MQALQTGTVLHGEIVVLRTKLWSISRGLLRRLASRAELLGLNLEHLVLRRVTLSLSDEFPILCQERRDGGGIVSVPMLDHRGSLSLSLGRSSLSLGCGSLRVGGRGSSLGSGGAGTSLLSPPCHCRCLLILPLPHTLVDPLRFRACIRELSAGRVELSLDSCQVGIRRRFLVVRYCRHGS